MTVTPKDGIISERYVSTGEINLSVAKCTVNVPYTACSMKYYVHKGMCFEKFISSTFGNMRLTKYF